MTINSFSFLFFFTIVFALYWAAQGRRKVQNTLLLVASYVFYGIAEWRMIPLLAVSTAVFYSLGLAVAHFNGKNERKASWLTNLSVVLGVGVLLYFKYLNFFIDSFNLFFTSIGLPTNFPTFNIIMPLGISFFTFKLISYVVEVHRERIEAERNFVSFAAYIAFFPTILSGPIDRPNKFLPQLQTARKFDYELAKDGLLQIFWGLFLKMCIADRMVIYIDAILGNVAHHNGLSITLAVLLYPLYMYTDFCGYSDTAIGIGKLLGFKVEQNFKYPFFGRNIAEYWRNWHMSLTSWLTDYVFMPLNIAFRNKGVIGSIAAIIITFVLIGLWHGASWTFALFGLYHGLLYIPLIVSGMFLKNKKLKLNARHLPHLSDARRMVQTYLLVAMGLILFRASNMEECTDVIAGICSPWGLPFIDVPTIGFMVIGLTVLFFSDVNGAWKTFPWIDRIPVLAKIVMIMLALAVMGVFDGSQFIYFQF